MLPAGTMTETETKIRSVPRITAAFLCFLLCVLALIRDPNALDSGQVPRLLVLNIGLLVALAAFLLPSVRRNLDWAALENRVVFAFAGYVVTVWMSLLVALNPSAGLLDASRSAAALIVLCLCVILFASSPEWRIWLARSATLAGLASGMIGLFQCYQCAVWNAPTRRWLQGISGLMGNVNLFAGYLLLLLPFCLAGVVLLRGAWRWGAFLATVNALFLIVLLQGRSAWMGAAAVIAVFFFAIFLRPGFFGFGKRTRFLIVAAVALSIIALIFFVKFSPPENPLASRMRAAFSEDIRFSDGGRLMIWRETFKMFADHFPFGVGAGNFTIHLQGYREGGGLDFSQIDSNWNQPHNDYLWILAEKGVFGFLAFILAVILAAVGGVRLIFQSRSREESWIATAALAGLVGYLVDSFFSFPLERVNHQTALAVILAALATAPANQKVMGFSRGGWKIPIFAASAFVILGIGIIITSVSLKQEYQVALARQAMSQGHWNTMQKHAQMARTPLRTLDTYAVPVSFLEGFAFMKQGRVDAAISLFKLADRENPDRFYILNNLAIMYAVRGEKHKADELFQRLGRLYPEHPEAACNLALFLLNQGKENEALQLIERIPRDKIPTAILKKFFPTSSSDHSVDKKN